MKKYLEECKAAYYAGKPIISDSQYDALEEMCSEDLSVGTNKGRYKHLYQMYSLKKYYVGEDELPAGKYKKTPKLDGAAISLVYTNGFLASAATRGDGKYGERVDQIISVDKAFKMGIPTHIKDKGLFQVVGEVVAKKNIPNSRNYASGALGLLSIEEFEDKEVIFVAYGMQESPGSTYVGTLNYLDKIGFNTVLHTNVDEYPQDGLVYRLSNNSEYIDAGYTSKHPRGAFALKERSEGVLTILLRVDWETGKSGKVTPVAILDPVNIDGANVSRATLNNQGFIKALDLRIGDAVMVERAGGIIPRIIRKAESGEIERAAKK